MTSLNKTKAQLRWQPIAAKLDGLRSRLESAQTWGQADVAALPALIQAEADVLQSQQPRSARVSRLDLENHAMDRLRRELGDRLKAGAGPLAKDIATGFDELRGLIAEQKRAIRAPKRPEAKATDVERYTGVPDSRSALVELAILNARLALAEYSSDELLVVLKDGDATEAERYVAETRVSRMLAKPIEATPDPAIIGEQALARHRSALQKHEADRAALAAVQDARASEQTKAREAALDAAVEKLDAWWARMRMPMSIIAETGQPMPAIDATTQRFITAVDNARNALNEAVGKETIAEASGSERAA